MSEQARKQREPAVTMLASPSELAAFLWLDESDAQMAAVAASARAHGLDDHHAGAQPRRPGATAVVGFFRGSPEDPDEDDEYRDFVEAAEQLVPVRDARAGAVFGALSLAAVDAGVIDRTPSLVLRRRSDSGLATAALDALDEGVSEWIDVHALPAVGELTAANFFRYEKLLRPMLLLFLDLRGHDRDNAPFVGGKSSGLFNEDLVNEVRSVARDESFGPRVAFAYCDGRLYADRMKSLGLFGGAERLPALAFNTNERDVLAPYPETLPIERSHLRDFVAAFLSRRLRSPADSNAFALQASSSSKAGVVPDRKPRKPDPTETVGVAEIFGESSAGVRARGKLDNVVPLVSSNFSLALADDKDVMIMFHARGCVPCAHLAVYYKKVAERFDEEGVATLLVARFDVTDEAPPLDNALTAAELPTILFLPADHKRPPYRFYSGVSKVQPIMRWAQASAAIPFDLPDLCHLSPDDRQLYKDQVTDREKARRAALLEEEDSDDGRESRDEL